MSEIILIFLAILAGLSIFCFCILNHTITKGQKEIIEKYFKQEGYLK